MYSAGAGRNKYVPAGSAPPDAQYTERDGSGDVTWYYYWSTIGPCENDPPPPVDPLEPVLTGVFPSDGMLVDSLTPLLAAKAQSREGNYAIRYAFKVCTNDAMSTGCFSSGQLANDDNNWRVPAGKLEWSKQYWWQVVATDTSNSTTDSWSGTFTTGVRQPVITSQLSGQGAGGQEFQHVTGNYRTTFTDAVVETVGPALSLVRTYNSLDPRRDSMFGAGWSTRYDMKIKPEQADTPQTLLVTYPDGSQVRFAAKGGGTFQAPPGMYATLAEISGGGWRLMDKASTSYFFDAQGRLTKVSDLRGRTQDLTYGTDGKLEKVTGVGGRSLTFTWSGARVATVSTAPVDGAALTWTYAYSGDILTQVCGPTAAPNCTTLSYDTGSVYRSAVLDSDPLGYWRLGEASGTAAADSGWGAGKATYTGTVKLGQPGPIQSSTDTAIQLTGTGEVALPGNAIARIGDSASFEAWFKTTQAGVIMSAGADSSAEDARSLVYVGTDGKLRGQFRPSTGRTAVSPITSAAAVNDGQWHHVVLTLAGTAQRMYLDGLSVGTTTGAGFGGWPVTASVGNGRPQGGLWPAGPATTQAFPFNGFLDEVAIFDKPLTADDVATHYASRTAAPSKLSKITLPSGRVWMTTVYSTADDRVKTHTDSNGGTWQVGAPVLVADTGVSTIKVTDPQNGTLTYVHDAWRGYRLTKQTDQLGKSTSYAYDTGGFLTKVTDANGNAVEQRQDERGNVLSSTTCRAAGNCQTSYSSYHVNKDDPFDPRNDRLTVFRDARSAGATDNTYASTREYNTHGELTKETSPATSDFPTGRSAVLTYTDSSEPAIGGGTTPAGLAKTKTDARGKVWSYAYTSAGDLAQQTSPTGLVIKLDYDVLGRLASSSEVSDAHPDGVTTTFAYNKLSQLLKVTAPGVKNEVSGVTHTRETSHTYDADGNKLTDTVSDLTGGDAARTTTYTYNPQGRVETITGPEGALVKQEWNTIGAVAKVTDARGTVIEHAYSKRGELITSTLKGWTGSPVAPEAARDVVLEARSYDPAGRLAGRVDAMGRKTTHTYYGDNRPSQIIADDVKLNGSTTARDVVLETNTYDAAGNLTKKVTGGGTATTEYVVDAAGRVSSQTFDPATLKRKTAFVYDAAGNLTKSTLTGAGTSRSEVREFAHNALGQVTRETIENGDEDIVSTVDYDDRGLATAITDPRGNQPGADAAAYTTTLRYDAAGQLVEAKAPQVQVDKAGTSSTTRPTTKRGYNAFGQPTHATDPEGRITTTGYDKASQPTKITASSYTPPTSDQVSGEVVTPTIVNEYDKAGQLVRTTDPRGYTTTTEYDQLGRPVRVTDPAPQGQSPGRRVTEYDLLGEKLATIDPNGARTESTYDDLGRPITATQIERVPTTAAYTTKLEYNNAGTLTKKTLPGNRVTSFTVNAAGEVTVETDPLTHKTTLAYDLAGRLLKTTDALGNATEAAYDLAGRQTTVKDLDAAGTVLRTASVAYDAAGNPINTTSAEGHTTKQTFDALNRATSLIEPVSGTESITTKFGYDASGARTRLTDGRGNASWTSYNSLGLPESLTEPATTAHPNLADRTWTSVYDAAGNVVSVVQPGGVRVDRTYDHLGRLIKESGAGAEAVTTDRTFGYDLAGRQTAFGDQNVEYNDRGLITKITQGAIQRTAYNYNELGQPTQRVDAAGTATFTWDNAGRLATGSDPVTGRTLTYGYDNADRLTSITPTSGQAGTQTYTYDGLDRVETHTLKNGSGTQLSKITYGWDKDDNLTSKVTAGLAGAGTNTYGYDHAGRLISWTAPGGTVTGYEWDNSGNRIKVGDKTFTYDERNRLTAGDGTDYTYTARGTLATETKGGTTRDLKFNAFDQLVNDGELAYTYDALGRMTSRAKAGGTQHFAYSGLTNDIAAVTDNAGAVQARYGRDLIGGILGVQEGGGAAVSALTDLHGDLVATFNATALVDSTGYDPFGRITAQTGTKRSLGYQGEYTDPDTGKVNMHARWYQPGSGAFSSRDSWTLAPAPSIQANRYTYANGTPLTATDPTGHSPLNDGYANGVPAGLPIYDTQTVVDVFAQYGISFGGGGTCTIGCELIGPSGAWPDGALYGPGGVGRLGYRDDKRACSMAEGGDCYQPWYIPKDVKWWDTPKEVRDEIMESYDPSMTDEDFTGLWAGHILEALGRASKNGGAFPIAAGRGKQDDWEFLKELADKAKKAGEAIAPYAKRAFCQAFTGTKDCSRILGVTKDDWVKFKDELKKLASFILRNAGLPADLVKMIIAESNLKIVEMEVIKWASNKGGATCKKVLYGMIACAGMPDLLVPRAALTIGTVVLTDMSLADFKKDAALMGHEYKHTQQWYHYANKTGFWFAFAILYWVEGSDACNNRYEIQAGLGEGHYKCP